jgi:hypothetical protein
MRVLALFLDPGSDRETRFAELGEQALTRLPPERSRQLCGHLAGEGFLDEGYSICPMCGARSSSSLVSKYSSSSGMYSKGFSIPISLKWDNPFLRRSS